MSEHRDIGGELPCWAHLGGDTISIHDVDSPPSGRCILAARAAAAEMVQRAGRSPLVSGHSTRELELGSRAETESADDVVGEQAQLAGLVEGRR